MNKPKHGHALPGKKSPTYTCWLNMRARCENKNREDFKNYGGRGIKVCKRWMKFDNFLKDMGVRPEKLTIERMDNDKDYAPSNCCWATRSQQRLNQRRTQ